MPIKRHVSLQPLARDHHEGLMAALLLEKGVRKKAGLNHLQDFCIQFFQLSLIPHFTLEEKATGPLLDHPDLKAGIEKMLHDHIQLKKIVAEIQQQPTYELIEQFSIALKEHIRFEDRVLFVQLERWADEAALATFVHEESIRNFCEVYPVKFWL